MVVARRARFPLRFSWTMVTWMVWPNRSMNIVRRLGCRVINTSRLVHLQVRDGLRSAIVCARFSLAGSLGREGWRIKLGSVLVDDLPPVNRGVRPCLD